MESHRGMVIALMVLLVVWVSVLSFLLLRTIANYNALTKGITEKTLSEVLKELLTQSQITQTEYKNGAKELKKLQNESLHFVRKVGFIRFNPFADTGGDQSFVLALLDGKNNGVVIASLYARTGMRWYIKSVKNGEGVEHELSTEEKEAIKRVQ